MQTSPSDFESASPFRRADAMAVRKSRGLRIVAWLAVSSGLLVLATAMVSGVEVAGRYCVLGGMLVAAVSQVVGFILLMNDPLKALLALIVPGYALFALNREGYYAEVVGSYMLGAMGLVVGTVLLS